MEPKKLPKTKRIKELLFYKDGELYWHKRSQKMAGYKCPKFGYKWIRVDTIIYAAHRLIYKYHHGKDPLFIDHIDRNKSNNRIENLRSVDKSENEINTTHRKTNKLKQKNIYYTDKAFRLKIERKGKIVIDKRYPTLDMAINARDTFCNESQSQALV